MSGSENGNWGPVIASYTRTQALEDGELYDVSQTAREAGFTVPVAISHAVWNEVVAPPTLAQMPGQDVDGRLWDVLWMARWGAGQHRDEAQFTFPVSVQTMTTAGRTKQDTITLKTIIGPGDASEPVLTIMWPYED